MSQVSSPRIQRATHLEDLVLKSERRVNQLREMNNQIKSQLESEQRKNNSQQEELSLLKAKLFQAEKQTKNLRAEFEDSVKNSSQELEDAKKQISMLSEQLKSVLSSQTYCSKCNKELNYLTSNEPTPSRASIIQKKRNSKRFGGLEDHVFFTQLSNQNNEENININFNIQTQEEKGSENEKEEIIDSPNKNLHVSVRFSVEQQAPDHFKALSKSIVAHNYESNFSVHQGQGSSGTQPPLVKREKSIQSNILLECKQVVSEEDLDESEQKSDDQNLDYPTEINPPNLFDYKDIIPTLVDALPQQVVLNKNNSNGNLKGSLLINFNKKVSRSRHSQLISEERTQDGTLQKALFESHQNKDIDPVIEETPKIHKPKQSLKLFENFFIIGSEKGDMIEFDSSCQQALLHGKILYSYPELTDSPQDQILSVVHDFALPKGIVSNRIQITSSLRKITDLILQSQKKIIQKQFYVFTMKSSCYFDKSSISEEDLQIINAVNPHRVLYCFCFKQHDYLDATTNQEAFVSKNRSQRRFWEGRKIFCFATFFPFYELFNEMLINVRNQVKICRVAIYSQIEKNNIKSLYEVDGDCIKQIVKDNLEKEFQKQIQMQISSFKQNIKIDTLAGTYVYNLVQKEIINTYVHKWSIPLTLSNLNLQSLMFIFHAILFEHTIVFNSKNKCLLTNTIHTFEQLIYPLSWPHPIIYLLPVSLEGMLDSPVPIIMGINKSADKMQMKDLIQQYKNHIFVDLDSRKIYCGNTQLSKEIQKEYAHLNNLENKLLKLYDQLNPQGLIAKKQFIFNTVSTDKQKDSIEQKLKWISSKQDDQISEIILNTFNESVRQCFVDILNKMPKQSLLASVDKVK